MSTSSLGSTKQTSFSSAQAQEETPFVSLQLPLLLDPFPSLVTTLFQLSPIMIIISKKKKKEKEKTLLVVADFVYIYMLETIFTRLLN